MGLPINTIRHRFDRLGMLLSCLCAVHCVAGVVIVLGLGLGTSFLLDPIIHEVGLVMATLVATVAQRTEADRDRRD